jgi:hypothetical protein
MWFSQLSRLLTSHDFQVFSRPDKVFLKIIIFKQYAISWALFIVTIFLIIPPDKVDPALVQRLAGAISLLLRVGPGPDLNSEKDSPAVEEAGK